MKSDEFKKKLAEFLSLFKNRPNHLANYLLENNALNKPFCDKIHKTDKLVNKKNFNNITEMEDFYSGLLDVKNVKKNSAEITKEVNEKMDLLIEEQRFEEAVKLRDYMIKNKIKRLK